MSFDGVTVERGGIEKVIGEKSGIVAYPYGNTKIEFHFHKSHANVPVEEVRGLVVALGELVGLKVSE